MDDRNLEIEKEIYISPYIKSQNVNYFTKCKDSLSKYLEFDIQLIFDKCDYAFPFGGCLRDTIAEQTINDVDILCLSKSYMSLHQILKTFGYVEVNEYINNPHSNKDVVHKLVLNQSDISTFYKDLHYIFEPITLFKNDKIVQLIRPSLYKTVNFSSVDDNELIEHFYKILKNVDLSCCALYLNSNGLFETQTGIIETCINKEFTINKEALMYNPKRIQSRIEKMEKRGWRNLSKIDYAQDSVDAFELLFK